MKEIKVNSLPEELSDDAAIEAAYGSDLDWILAHLERSTSVMIECEKDLTVYLYKAIRARLRQSGSSRKLRLISGQQTAEASGPAAMQTFMQRLLSQFQDAVFSSALEEIIVLPHLDILTTTTRSGLNVETREAAALMYENPNLTLLGFKDPSFELPKVIEHGFPVKRSLLGIARDRLPALICAGEARKFAVEDFDPYSLYKYVSGLNAIRLRRILFRIRDRLDFNSSTSQSRDEILHEIRQMTLVSDVDLPNTDLDRDIGGYDEVKQRLRKDILELLLAKESMESEEEIRFVEEIIPKGMIFFGPPGTGKTYFAKAIATALNASITIVSGPELKSKWVGESEENLRRVFAQARKAAPSLIVFDELDSFASARGGYVGSGVEHSMVNQMLTEMDGFRKEEMVFVIGTTNFLESLDTALLRPGRFELCIEIPAPNEKDRKAILEIYRKKFGLSISEEVLDYMVRKTSGFVDERATHRFTGDHLNALMRALKREELRKGKRGEPILNADVDAALSKSSKPVPELQAQEELVIAVHEAGHAVLAYCLPNCPSIEKVTISTGDDETLGYVMQAVKKNKYVTTDDELLDDVCVLLGGRAAERMMFSRISVGAHNDLQRANEIARMMVEELGMSENLGVRVVPQAQPGDSRGQVPRRKVSDTTHQTVDEAIAQILAVQQERAERLLVEYRPVLEKMSRELIQRKTLKLEDIKDMFEGKNFKEQKEPDLPWLK